MFAASILIGLFLSFVQSEPPVQRILTASHVQLRAAPEANADRLSGLPFGTIVTQLAVSNDGEWYRVGLTDGRQGWVFGGLTRPFSARDSAETYHSMIQTRLETGRLTFSEASELFNFVDGVAARVDSAVRADFELFRLRALHRSLDDIHSYEPKNDAHRAWIKQHEADLAYSEPAGQWLVRAELYWELEARHRGKPLADEIAWEGARTGLPGECEGYIPCYLEAMLVTDARYLDLYPNGAHASEAIENIDYFLKDAIQPNGPFTADPADAMQIRNAIARLTRILERTSARNKSEMIARFKQVEKMYTEF